MKKYLFLCLSAILALALVSCSSDNSDDNDLANGDDKVNNEEVYKKLVGEWICYYQYWEESEVSKPYQEDAYYNTDDFAITFNEDLTGYLKVVGSPDNDYDGLLEHEKSESFTYKVDKLIIYTDDDDQWLITSLTDTELHIKWQDGDYIIIAKFVRRTPLSGKVSEMIFQTEYSESSSSNSYSFSYNFRGELNGIAYNNSKLTFGSYQNGERNITWYNGDKFKLVDKDKSAEIFLRNSSIANAQYDDKGYLVAVSSGNRNIKYKYSNGNLSSWEDSDLKIDYEYSKEKNDANIDLNYFIDYFLPSQGHHYDISNYLELGFNATKSNNLVSKAITPSYYDYYFTYSYERNSDGKISKIERKSIDRFSNNLLNKCTIKVEYYK